MTHLTHFIYGYMASNIWLRTIQIAREETRCHHMGYSFRLAARVLIYAPSHIQDSTYHSLCFSSHVALAGTRNISMGPPHEGSMSKHSYHRALSGAVQDITIEAIHFICRKIIMLGHAFI